MKNDSLQTLVMVVKFLLEIIRKCSVFEHPEHPYIARALIEFEPHRVTDFKRFRKQTINDSVSAAYTVIVLIS